MLEAMEFGPHRLHQVKVEPSKFSREKICPLPFDKRVIFYSFPQNVKILKYDKYHGTSNPYDHLRQFYMKWLYFLGYFLVLGAHFLIHFWHES